MTKYFDLNNERLHQNVTVKGCVALQKQHEYHLDYGHCTFTYIHFYLWDTDEEVVDSITDSTKTQILHGNNCQELLFGAGLDVKLWPYAFMHVLHIHNALPGQGQNASTCLFPQDRKIIFELSGYLAVENGVLTIAKLLKDLILSQQKKIINFCLSSIMLYFMVVLILKNLLKNHVLTKPSTNLWGINSRIISFIILMVILS